MGKESDFVIVLCGLKVTIVNLDIKVDLDRIRRYVEVKFLCLRFRLNTILYWNERRFRKHRDFIKWTIENSNQIDRQKKYSVLFNLVF